MMKQNVHERFLAKIVAPSADECWQWTACTDSHGYGHFKVDGRGVGAHRFAYEYFVGPIPDGLELDHLCRVRNCVNPAHLEAVTHAENIRRGESPLAINAAKTHCLKGHPLDAENTYRWRGGRHCRICVRARVRAYRARKRAKAAAA